MTYGEVANFAEVAEQTIYRLARARQIPALKAGNDWRFRTADIDRWIGRKALGNCEVNSK